MRFVQPENNAEKFTLLDAVPSFAPAENDVRAEQSWNALVKLLPLLKSKAGKLVSPLALKAFWNVTFVLLVPSFAPAGNDVRAVQFCHASWKEVPFLASIAAKSLRDMQDRHAR